MDDVTVDELNLKVVEPAPGSGAEQLNPNGPERILGDDAAQHWDIVVE